MAGCEILSINIPDAIPQHPYGWVVLCLGITVTSYSILAIHVALKHNYITHRATERSIRAEDLRYDGTNNV